MMITLASGQFGGDYVVEAGDGRTILVQTDWDYPGLARAFGWNGKVNQRKYKYGAGAEIATAREYLDANIGKRVRDRGMFYEDNPACGCAKAEAYKTVRGVEKARGKQVRKLGRAMGRAGQTFPNPTPMTYDQAYAYLLAHGFRPVPGSSRFENQAGDAGRIEPHPGGRHGGDEWIVDIEVGGGMQKYGGHRPRFDNPASPRRGAKPNPAGTKRPSSKGKRGVLFEVELDNQGEEGMVTAAVYGKGAAKWAKQDQSIGGARWEADGPDFAYAVIGDYPGLVDELLREGYHMNLSKYG